MESDPEDSDEYNSNDEDSENDNHNVVDPITPKKCKDKSAVSKNGIPFYLSHYFCKA